MKITLCLETSGAHCSVALASGEEIFSEHRQLGRTHNEHLLSILDAVFDRAGVTPTDIELVSFGCGPGSFTGVRIAAATCQALALAADCQVVVLPSSQVLAASARRQSGGDLWLCVLPSRADQHYLSAYRWLDGQHAWSQLEADCLCAQTPDWVRALAEEGKRLGLAGSPPDWLQAPLSTAGATEPDAVDMVPIARSLDDLGFAVDPALALPMYLKGDSPWVKQR